MEEEAYNRKRKKTTREKGEYRLSSLCKVYAGEAQGGEGYSMFPSTYFFAEGEKNREDETGGGRVEEERRIGEKKLVTRLAGEPEKERI